MVGNTLSVPGHGLVHKTTLVAKNFRFSDTVCLSIITHSPTCISPIFLNKRRSIHKTRSVGTKRYDFLDSQKLSVGLHCHDNNTFVSELIKERGCTENTLDTWHANKAIARKAN